jgi:hypothetical protein
MSPEAANTIRCPKCGAENPLPSGARLVRCAFCDAALYVDRGGAVAHYRLPRLLSLEDAAAALRRWMAGNETVKDLDSKATLGSVVPLSFPMWFFRFDAGGHEETLVEPAAATPVPQLADLRVPAGQLLAYAPEAGVEETAASVPLETARGWLVQRGTSEPRETALVHLPLWRCEYAFAGKSWSALVDGSTGAVIASVFPAKAETPYRAMAAVGLVLFVVEGLAIGNVFVKLVVYALTALPLVGLSYLVTRRV